jgi:hypothetical protein
MNVRQIWSTCDLSITGLMDGREERAAGTGFGTLSSGYIVNGSCGSSTGTIKYTKRCTFGDLNTPGTTAYIASIEYHSHPVLLRLSNAITPIKNFETLHCDGRAIFFW